MTLKQYSTIKRLTLAIICCCLFLLFFEIGAIFVIHKQTKAADTCGGNIVFAFNAPVQIEVPTRLSLTKNGTGSFNYTVYLTDVATKQNYDVTSGSFDSSTINQDIDFTVNNVGDKAIYIHYTQVVDQSTCTPADTSPISFKAVDNRTNSANISISASPSQANKGTTINIDTTIQNAVYKTAVWYINTGEAGCDINSQVQGCWSEKWRQVVNSNSEIYNWKWETPNSVPGRHVIKVKVFTPEGNDSLMTDMKPAYVNICDENGKNCGGNDTLSGSTDTESTAPVDPVGINDTFGPFSLSRGSGIGGIIQMIIKLLVELAGALSFISLLVAGVQYITAGGDNTKADKAKKTIIYSVTAIILAVLSYTIFQLIVTNIK